MNKELKYLQSELQRLQIKTKTKWQDFRTGPYFIMHTAFVLEEQYWEVTMHGLWGLLALFHVPFYCH